MASGKVCWDIEQLRSSVHTWNAEKENLCKQRDQMTIQKNRVDVSWKSPAGQQYQNRLVNDIAVLDNIIIQLEKQLNMLQKVLILYTGCEEKVSAALKRLPV